MSLLIQKPGLLDTIQDQGRFGHAQLGVNPTGAMDPAALAVANFLVGNPSDEAAVEIHFPGPAIQFEHAALFALSGGNFTPQLDGSPIPMNTPVRAVAGSTLTFSKNQFGARSYLAVQGGFDIEPWLGSRSANLKALGGALKTGDLLAFRQKNEIGKSAEKQPAQILPWKVDTSYLYPPSLVLRFCAGPEHHWLAAPSKDFLEQSEWLITPQSDRMGYQMRGPELQLEKPQEMVSSAVVPGVLQLLPGGNFIILMADCQTTGGYPRIGQIIRADLPRLAQLPPGQRIQLQQVNLETAFEALRQQEQLLRQLQWSCTFRLKN